MIDETDLPLSGPEQMEQQEQEAAVQVALWDDFAVSPDAVVHRTVRIRGQNLVFGFARGITLAQRQRAAEAGIRKHVNARGEMVIDAMDESKTTVAILSEVLKEWPFEKNGAKVPITPEHIAQLGADVNDLLLREFNFLTAARQNALSPFEQPSDADSTPEGTSIQ